MYFWVTLIPPSLKAEVIWSAVVSHPSFPVSYTIKAFFQPNSLNHPNVTSASEEYYGNTI
jgi:hypothetical protein